MKLASHLSISNRACFITCMKFSAYRKIQMPTDLVQSRTSGTSLASMRARNIISQLKKTSLIKST